jgi:biotin transport system ATP-binding protein
MTPPPANVPPPIIEIRGVAHRFPDGTPGLRNVDLCIGPGELVLIAGENGSGKTTLLKHLNALLRPSRGSIVVDGKDVTQNPIQTRQKVGLVFQNPDHQIVGETVYADAAFGPENLKLTPERVNARVEAALNSVSLLPLADRQPHLLSGGEKRRLTVAGVLAMKPKILALDEPFSSLDYAGIREVLRQILDLHQSGCTVVVTTHDVEKVIAHADRLVVLHRGSVVADGPPAQIATKLERYGVRPPCALRWGKPIESWLI